LEEQHRALSVAGMKPSFKLVAGVRRVSGYLEKPEYLPRMGGY
jgi:hypothetical protein